MDTYQYIVNPLTNRRCKIDSVLGKKIVKNYIGNMVGGQQEYQALYDLIDERYINQYKDYHKICKQYNDEKERIAASSSTSHASAEDESTEMPYEVYMDLMEQCLQLEELFEGDGTENGLVLFVLKWLVVHGNLQDQNEASDILSMMENYDVATSQEYSHNEFRANNLTIPLLEIWEKIQKQRKQIG